MDPRTLRRVTRVTGKGSLAFRVLDILDEHRRDARAVFVLGAGPFTWDLLTLLDLAHVRAVVGVERGQWQPFGWHAVLERPLWVASLAHCAALVVACPLDETTRGLVDAHLLSVLDDAVLVDCSPEGVVDPGGVAHALAHGHLRAVRYLASIA